MTTNKLIILVILIVINMFISAHCNNFSKSTNYFIGSIIGIFMLTIMQLLG